MVFIKKLEKHMTRTNGQTLSNTMAYIRRTLCFELQKATLMAVRGHRGKYYEKALPIEELDINLVEARRQAMMMYKMTSDDNDILFKVT